MSFCSSCGTAVLIESAFCSKCGTATFTPAKSQPEQPLAQAVLAKDDEALKIFVGKNYEYFTRKWEIAEKKKSKQSWNWAAFLLGFSWMAYRKMYLYSWIFIGVVIVETLCEFAFAFPDKLSNALNFGISAIFGWQGNSLYKLHVEKKLKEINTTNTPEQAKIELARQGGTNIGAAIGFAVALLALTILVNVVANPEVKQYLESLGETEQVENTQPSVDTQPPQAVKEASVSSQAKTYQYEPEIVTLQGTLLSAPGVTPDGAEITFPALQLVAPITVQATPGDKDKDNETEQGVLLIQLALDDKTMGDFKSMKGWHVTITGTLYHQYSGQHYTRVLITPNAIMPVN